MTIFDQIPYESRGAFRTLLDARVRIETDTRRACLSTVAHGVTSAHVAASQDPACQRQMNREAVFAQDFGLDPRLVFDRAVVRARAFQILDLPHELALWVDAMEPVVDLPDWLLREDQVQHSMVLGVHRDLGEGTHDHGHYPS
jgi:hypothetical protein